MRSLVLVLLLLLVPTDLSARSHRVDQVPYGSRWGCTSCHTSPGGGGVLTGFGSDTILALVGSDLLQERDFEWSQIYQIDSDLDGFTNGEEVFDTMGTWQAGDRDPIGGVPTNPGDPNSHPLATCGDGRVTPPEECDGTNLRDFTCVGLGYEPGTLTCKSDCSFDRSGCPGAPVEEPEDNRPTDLGTPLEEEDSACAVGGVGASLPSLLLILFVVLRRRR